MMQQADLGSALAAAAVLGALLPCAVDATLLRRERDMVHRIEKTHVTEVKELHKRALQCPVGNRMCPESVGGACCPDSYACAKDHCFATTAGSGVVCGKQGYYACPASLAGCCPQGYICQSAGCGIPAGATLATLPCPTDMISCPANLGGGCCRTGMGCGLNMCTSTDPKTFTFTKTETITENSRPTTKTTTVTTTSIPPEPTGLPDGTTNLPKLFVTQLDKIQPSEVPTGDSGGLTTAQIGGIAGGVGGLLVAVLVATFLIIRRLKKTQQAVDESRRGSSAATRTNRSHKHMTQSSFGGGIAGYPKPTPSQIDAMEYDDLLQSNASTALQTPMQSTGAPASTIGGRVSSEITPSSRPTPNPDGRHTSDYFDMPEAIRNGTSNPRHSVGMSTNFRSSIDSQGTAVAAEMMGSLGPPAPLTAAAIAQNQRLQQQQDRSRRHHSNSSVSVQSWGSHELTSDSGLGSAGLPAELVGQGSHASELPVEQTSSELAGSSVPPQVRRRSTGDGTTSPGPVTRPPATYQRAAATGNLDVVNESAAEMHGYYGPPDAMSGQTHVPTDLSSPVVIPFNQSLSPNSPGSDPSNPLRG
ncbi:hypothetical protein GGTG_10413 [Gaeumannomyces tritici R3-111a-1]|uniref:Uncharacterized protein n=1 Tax=Gaeumannomyces tritici (strain R3-111a-1) TaxID=644352 RepID=J3PA87_GAET3|nr:hypothetical protein GGTG_10413 [Gaeumannomyces tritici R3-111a-1]EJT71153.1 hypothetical protein GGTG_10413 [Gaeumannomyces tritici R3-111a-1]